MVGRPPQRHDVLQPSPNDDSEATGPLVVLWIEHGPFECSGNELGEIRSSESSCHGHVREAQETLIGRVEEHVGDGDHIMQGHELQKVHGQILHVVTGYVRVIRQTDRSSQHWMRHPKYLSELPDAVVPGQATDTTPEMGLDRTRVALRLLVL